MKTATTHLLLALSLLSAGCTDGGGARADRTPAGSPKDTVPRVRVAAVHEAVAESPSFLTYIEAEHEAEIVAETEGEVFDVRVREGARVAAGDTLLGIDDRDERLAVARDEAEYRWAQGEVRRLEQLTGGGHSSAREMEEVQLKLERARASLGLSRAALDRCWLRAPIAGLVWMVRVEPHRRVSKGEMLCRVTDPGNVRVSVYLPEAFRQQVRMGQRVVLQCDRTRTPMTAVVSRIDPVTDPASGTFRVTAGFRRRPGDPEPGADVRIVFPGRARTAAVALPERAILEGNGDSTWIWRYEGNRVRRVPVRLGTYRDGLVQVEEGLSAGALVVVESSRPLVDGAAVEVTAGP